jgi:HD-like signal output (HDOD) protein/CheY-like chemotaxis protein
MAEKRILIADADAKVWVEFREALGESWAVVGAATASAAQEEAQKQSFQVVVANFDLPDLSGAELLNRLRTSSPKTLRFIAAAEALKEKVMTHVLRGHQFLAIPFDRETLKSSIERSMAADYGMNNSLRELVGRIRTFPTIPSLYLEVVNALKDPNATTDEIGAIIAKDMAMTTKLVQVLNSAYFGLPRTITDPTEAVGILGFETVKSLIMTVKLLSQYDKVKPVYFSIDSIWRHSTNVARTARVMALLETGDNDCSGIAYTAGLMHDLGKVILAANFDEQYQGAHNVARKQQIPLWEVEKDIFGASHGEIGAYLLGLWGMSSEVVKVAALHHSPLRSDDKTFSPLTAVHVANALEYEGTLETDGLPLPQLDVDYLKQLGVEARVDLWRLARSDPEGTTMETRAQRAKAKREPEGTTMETKAQRAKASAKTATKNADSAPASEAAPPVNKYSPSESSGKPFVFGGAWKWIGIGLGATAAMVLLARLAITSMTSPAEQPEVKTVAEKPAPPVKHEVAAVVAPAKPVEEAKPASVLPTNSAPIAAAQTSPAPTNAPAPAAPKTALDQLKLQAIFYSSQHPSALISGQLASVDDEVAKCRILDISPSSVTVEYLHQRRTLNLR